MKKIKKILIILIIVLLIILIIMGVAKKKEHKNEIIYEEAFDAVEPNEENFTKISFREYEIIKNCLQKYINTLNIDNSAYYGYNDNGEYAKVIEEADIKQNIYNLISEEFIQENNISAEKVYDYVDLYNENKIVIPIQISKLIKENRNTYFVYALISSVSDMTNALETKFIVNIDNSQYTFSIEPIDINTEIKDIKLEDSKINIAKKNNNAFVNIEVKQEDIAEGYFTNYKNILLSRADIAYNYLNEEYREKRFDTLESFKQYIDKNRDLLEKIRIVSYEYISDQGNKQFVCSDQFNNAYIFEEKNTLDYNVILDLYTIDLPQFIEKYDSSNEQEKVLLNIEKIKQALNSGDYSYVYSKLADSFKSSKYKTQEEFENYIKNTLYNNIDIEYKTFSNEGQTYIYDITIKNLTNESDESINMQIIMQLKDNRDFVMSFSIK